MHKTRVDEEKGRTCVENNLLLLSITIIVCRCDGRGTNDLRPIECEIDLFELLHGSARFSRGETQVMTSVTLDSPEHAAKADEISLLIGFVIVVCMYSLINH